MAADVAQRRRAQQGVGEGVADRVTVRMPQRAHGTLAEMDPAQYAAPLGYQLVAIDALTDAQAHPQAHPPVS